MQNNYQLSIFDLDSENLLISTSKIHLAEVLDYRATTDTSRTDTQKTET
jgi:hypothetical protein